MRAHRTVRQPMRQSGAGSPLGIGLAPVDVMPRIPLTPTRRLLLAVTLGTSLVAAPGCRGDGGGPVGPDPSIAGRWHGSAYLGLVDFRATFTQAGDAVGGTGYFSSPDASDDFTVAGTLVEADVDIVLTSDELGATTFRGRFTAADRIEGTLDLQHRDDIELTLERED